MPLLHLVLLAFAFVLFVLAAVGVTHARVNLMALGLAFLTLALWLH